ncbi:tRNA 2-thiouridine(34) synthase MnmA [Selenomonadales bacterium OttesenSCG-928-I06]|nr:tRNA 2-thiouridine(34) synthase MnmA [Selenomonadales bacterium OttesenSCG-928-I06]
MSIKEKVLIAMSGGVDSSLTAALLKHQGYDLIGLTMNLHESINDEAINDAKKIADELNIPHYTVNFKDIFQKKVVDYFLQEYSFGKTPNPCVACNKHIKFQALLDKAFSLGANYIATGHYARVSYNDSAKNYELLKGIDKGKDQSYVLYNLTQEILKHVLLPLGEYTKEQTRTMAKDLGLKIADKPDSQEICFIPDNDYKKFFKEKMPNKLQKGNIVDKEGNKLGEHEGISMFTIGQRKGLIAAGKPIYVTAINSTNNEVVVGDNEDLFSNSLIAQDVNFISTEELRDQIEIEAKIRYSAKPALAKLFLLDNKKVQINFIEPQRAITPGQAVVFYQGEKVLGGGTIETVNNI